MKVCPECGTRYSVDRRFCPRDGATLEEAPTTTQALYDPFIGETIDNRYRVEALIGEGATSTVYAAHHKAIERRVVMKILRAELARDPVLAGRFVQEAKAASKIGHPNVVDILDFGRLPNGSAYLVMEFLDGRSLTDILKREGAMKPERAAGIMGQVCRALAAAHQKGIVHRDLKPDNIFLVTREGRTDFVKILDFGIAKVAGANTRLTKTGLITGTPDYMAPEQAAGQPLDHRVDIYSVGVILFRMITDRLPFTADNFTGVLAKHMFDPPPHPGRLRPDLSIPEPLSEIVLRALAKDRNQRFASMTDFHTALLQFDVHGYYEQAAEGEARKKAQAGEPRIIMPKAPAPRARSEPAKGAKPDGPRKSSTAQLEGQLEARLAAKEEKGPKVVRPRPSLGPHPAVKEGRGAAAPASSIRSWLGWAVAALAIGALTGLLLLTYFPPDRRKRNPQETSDRPGGRIPQMNRHPEGSGSPGALLRPEKVKLVVNTVPPGAEVFIGSNRLGKSPLTRLVKAGAGPAELMIMLEGYKPVIRTVSLNRPLTLNLRLERFDHGGRAGRRPPGRPPSRKKSGLEALKDPFQQGSGNQPGPRKNGHRF